MNINFKGGYFNFIFFNRSDWTRSSESMDNVQSVHGLSGLCGHWPVCLDFVQGVHGQCPDYPLSPWTMSTESMDIVQSGWSHWTLSMVNVHGQYPGSMDFLQMGRWGLESFNLAGVGITLFRRCWSDWDSCGCAGWSAPLLFTYGKNRFSYDTAQIVKAYCLYNYLQNFIQKCWNSWA